MRSINASCRVFGGLDYISTQRLAWIRGYQITWHAPQLQMLRVRGSSRFGIAQSFSAASERSCVPRSLYQPVLFSLQVAFSTLHQFLAMYPPAPVDLDRPPSSKAWIPILVRHICDPEVVATIAKCRSEIAAYRKIGSQQNPSGRSLQYPA